MLQNPVDDVSALVQLMTWCRQAASTNVDPDRYHYMGLLPDT